MPKVTNILSRLPSPKHLQNQSLKEILVKRWKIVAIVGAVLLLILILGLGLGLGLRKKSSPEAPSATTLTSPSTSDVIPTTSSPTTTLTYPITTPSTVHTTPTGSISTTTLPPTTTSTVTPNPTHTSATSTTPSTIHITSTLPPVNCNITQQKLYLTMLFDNDVIASVYARKWMKPLATDFVTELRLNETTERKVRIGLVNDNFTWMLNYSNDQREVMTAVNNSCDTKGRGPNFNLGSALETIANETGSQKIPSGYSSFITIFSFSSIGDEEKAINASERLRQEGEHLLGVTRDEATEKIYEKIITNPDDILAYTDYNSKFAKTWLESRVCYAVGKPIFAT